MHKYMARVAAFVLLIGLSLAGTNTPAMAACPYTGNTSGTDSAGMLSALNDICGQTPLSTYAAVANGYTAYATPTDLVCISGSASRVVRVTHAFLGVNSTSSTLYLLYWIKRSAADTGGTSSTAAAIPYDSTDAAATATVTVYTAAPSVGAAVGNVRIGYGSTAVATNQPGFVVLNNSSFPAASRITLNDAITLHGVAESLCMNWNGAALPSGYTSVYAFEWTESAN